jgi:hypothetical protein
MRKMKVLLLLLLTCVGAPRSMANSPRLDQDLVNKVLDFILAHPERLAQDCRACLTAAAQGRVVRLALEVAVARAVAQPLDLPDFAPWRALAVGVVDPSAGPPGRMLCDVRLVHHPASGRLVLADREWIAGYRRASPWHVEGASDEQLLAYLRQIDALLGRATTARIPHVAGMRRVGPRAFEPVYADGQAPALGKVELGQDGGVIGAALPGGG